MSESLDRLQAEIATTARQYGHPAPTLVVVTKTRTQAEILPLLEAGHRDFGENYAQELLEKWPPLIARYPDARLHFIGRLQSRKVKQIAPLCRYIHTLDSDSAAKALCRYPVAQVFVQVNIGAEPQKGGILPQDTARCVQAWRGLGLPVTGLMAMAPKGADPLPYFSEMRALQHASALPHLSVGMSQDWPQALSVGADFVRLGRVVFTPQYFLAKTP